LLSISRNDTSCLWAAAGGEGGSSGYVCVYLLLSGKQTICDVTYSSSSLTPSFQPHFTQANFKFAFDEQGFLFIVVLGLLIAVASLPAEHGL